MYGLEISEKGAEVARQYSKAQLAEPLDYHYGKGEGFREGKKGEVKIIAGDFFARDWEADCGFAALDDDGFDLIYDYTVSL